MRAAIVVLLVAPLAGPAQEKPDELIRSAITAAGGAETLRRFPAGRCTAKGTIYEGGGEVAVAVEQSFHIPGRCRTVMRTEPRGQKLELCRPGRGDDAGVTLGCERAPNCRGGLIGGGLTHRDSVGEYFQEHGSPRTARKNIELHRVRKLYRRQNTRQRLGWLAVLAP